MTFRRRREVSGGTGGGYIPKHTAEILLGLRFSAHLPNSSGPKAPVIVAQVEKKVSKPAFVDI